MNQYRATAYKKFLFLSLFILCAITVSYHFLIWYNEKRLDQALSDVSKYFIDKLDNHSILGQIFFLYLPPRNLNNIVKIQPGSLFLQGESIPQKNGQQNLKLLKEKLQKIIDLFKKRGIPPPFIATDQEFGRVQRIKRGVHSFPSAMAMGRATEVTGNFEDIYWIAFHSCFELRKLNINWPLAPVADLNNNPENPVIGTRSFGENPKFVSSILQHYVRGLHDGGCMSTLKHFPGHGGTLLDSHNELPIIQKTLSQLEDEELVPFHSVAKFSLSIMTGHIYLPKIDPQIVTFSSYWIQKYLRKKLDFQGLIITDDLGMRAVTPAISKESALQTVKRSIESGVDIILLASGIDTFAPYIFDSLLLKMEETLFKEKILFATKRLLTYKLKLCLYQNDLEEKLMTSNFDHKEYLKRSMLRIKNYCVDAKEKSNRLEKKAPEPQKLNDSLSKNAIRYIKGKPRKISPNESFLFTGVKKENLHCYGKAHFLKSVSPFHALLKYINKPNFSQEIIILHESASLNFHLTKFLRARHRPPVTFLTVLNPFPYSKLRKIFHHENDRLVVTFSDTPTSRKALEESLCKLEDVKVLSPIDL